MTSTHLKGLIAAPFTAFHLDGTLHLEMIDRQAHSLAANGIVGAFVCGTTGEGLSLTTEERMQVAERWMAAAPASLRIIVHVGHHAIGDCQRLARHAAEIGAAAIGTLAPSFFKAACVSDLVDFCSGVASSAPELPFYYYHIPTMTGVSLPCVDFLTAAGGRIPNLAGLKFTFENLMDFLACVQLEGGRYDVIFGRDEILLAGLALGRRPRSAARSTLPRQSIANPGVISTSRPCHRTFGARSREWNDLSHGPARWTRCGQGNHGVDRTRLRPSAVALARVERRADRLPSQGIGGARI
jgi:dihydrodipicolinate synthase/N-acetylneuraminate lyase